MYLKCMYVCYLVTLLCVVSFQDSFSYSNCACVAKTGQTSGEARKGTCGVDCRLKLLLFLIILALMPFTACVNDIPATIVTLRFAMYITLYRSSRHVCLAMIVR